MFLWLFFALIAVVHSRACPGGTATCPDTATCCELADKSYGCCPLENAVCCDDHIHCCPQNTKCAAGLCIDLNGLNVTAERIPAQDENQHCFHSEYTCPDNFTCCKALKSGAYGCCPLSHAVCCSDGYHCCPKGTVCDLDKGKCLDKGYVYEMYDSQKMKSKIRGFAKYLPTTKPNNDVSSVVCPGASFQCPNGYTCCKLPSGDWGCCPFVNATCCTDHLHCCPPNMQCDSTSKACFQGQLSVPSLPKEPSESINVGITCPDNFTCADSMTCCKINDKHFGCCPYPDAVCCEDRSHCCPHDFICDLVEKQCVPKRKWLFNIV